MAELHGGGGARFSFPEQAVDVVIGTPEKNSIEEAGQIASERKREDKMDGAGRRVMTTCGAGRQTDKPQSAIVRGSASDLEGEARKEVVYIKKQSPKGQLLRLPRGRTGLTPASTFSWQPWICRHGRELTSPSSSGGVHSYAFSAMIENRVMTGGAMRAAISSLHNHVLFKGCRVELSFHFALLTLGTHVFSNKIMTNYNLTTDALGQHRPRGF